MNNKRMLWVFGVIGLVGLLLIPGTVFASGNILMTAENFIASFEGFSGKAYWDVSRYSWGYGTIAPGADARISEQQARDELKSFIQSDLTYLQSLITVPLNANQWAALLSFSYNLGKGNADNLVANINAGDNDALGNQWLQYNRAGGSYNPNLAARREKEWAVWNS